MSSGIPVTDEIQGNLNIRDFSGTGLHGNLLVERNLTIGGSILGRGATPDWVNARSAAYGALGDGVTDDTAAIQAALNAARPGQVVYLPQGTYAVTAPLTVPASVVMSGSSGNVLSLTSYGSILKPLASWAQGGAAAAAVLLLASATEEQKIQDLTIDGSSLPVVADGINSQGAASVYLANLAIDNVTGNAVNQGASSAAWRAYQITAHRAGLSGFVLNGSDQSWLECIAQGCGQTAGAANTTPGWSIATCSNSQFSGCRSENTTGLGNGFTYSGANSASTGVQFAGCSTNFNGGHGIEITSSSNSGSGPVTLTGCRFGGDGFNPYPSGTGGGNFAGIFITNVNSPVLVSGCAVVPAAANAGHAPQYGISLSSANGSGRGRVQIADSLLWGNTGPLLTDGSTLLRIAPSCVLSSGAGSAPVHTALTGQAVLVAGSVVVACPVVTAGSRILLTSQVPGGTPGWLQVSARAAGTSFTITSSSSTDTSTVGYAVEVA